MMKFRIIIAAVLLLAILSTDIGCSEPTEGEAQSFVELMKRVPKDSTNYIFWDVEALGSDAYAVCWRGWKEEEKQWLNTVGIKYYEVKYFAQAFISDIGVINIVTGSFIMDEVEQKLTDDGYNLYTYQGITLLVKTEDSKEVAVALYKGVITGDMELVKKCIDVIQGVEREPSLYEDQSVKEIADKLPGGVMTGIAINDTLYEELIGIGMSVGKKDDKTLKVKAVYKFAASGAARSEYTLDKIKDDLTAMNLPSIKVKCFEPEAIPKEKFVEATASMYITDFSYFGLDQ